MQVPPPSRWQGEDPELLWLKQSRQRSGAETGVSTPSATQPVGVETTKTAWKHIKAVATDDEKSKDLYDLLRLSGNEGIDPMPAGSLSLSRPRRGSRPTKMLNTLSAVASAAQAKSAYDGKDAAHGHAATPFEIPIEDKEASASHTATVPEQACCHINGLTSNDVPLEYSNEDQSISAVGLVRPRADIFQVAVQQLLVVCTTTEIVFLGVCCSPGQTQDPLHDLSLIQLPGYSMSADNVTMCTVASTRDGRVFLGGNDGHLYEVQYHLHDGWMHKRFSKRDHSRSFTALLPSFVPALWHKPSALIDIVIDHDRHILYARFQSSAIQVFDLGVDGKDTRQVADMSDFLAAAAYAAGGEVFRGRSPADKKGGQVLHMAVIKPCESARLHLVAVTLDGRRVYLTTQPGYGFGPQNGGRPQGLKALIARQAPPQPSVSAARGGASPAKGLEATVALCDQGMLLLAEEKDSRSKVLMAARDMTVPLLAPTSGSSRPLDFREAVGELDMLVPGEICFIQAIGEGSPLTAVSPASPINELAAQTVASPPHFVLVSTAGILEFEKRRPVDMLHQMFEERSGTKLEQFFRSYGAAEVAAMCFLLINAAPQDASVSVVQQAKSTLENANLTGVPHLRSETGTENIPPQEGFDMGQALPIAEPEWSGAHKGLCMYVARLVQPIWEEPVVAPVARPAGLLACHLPAATLQAFEARLRNLEGFLREYQQRRRNRTASRATSQFEGGLAAFQMEEEPLSSSRGAASLHVSKRPRLEEAVRQEDQRVGQVRGLVARAAEACFLLRTLSEHHMPRLVSRLEEPFRSRLLPLKLRDWVCSSEGEAVAAQLISVLVTEHLSATGGIAEDLAASLQSGCPGYFKHSDKLFYQASGMLQRAESAASPADRESLTQEAVRLMMQVPLSCDLGQVIPQLAYLQNFSACVELPLQKASALDPANLASANTLDSQEAKEKRYEMCYIHVMQVLKFLILPGSTGGAGSTAEWESKMSTGERESAKTILLQRAARAEDAYFHEVLYTTLVDLSAVKELISLDNGFLEQYLKTAGGLSATPVTGPIGPLTQAQVQNLELLAKLYRKREDAVNATAVYELLASRKSGLADQAISLAQREEAYQEAVLQARGTGNGEAVDRLEVRHAIVQLQQQVVDALAGKAAALPDGSNERAVLQDAVADLREQPKELAQLYNDFAVPHQLWALGLEMIALSSFNNPAYIGQLWDVYLRQAWESRWEAALAAASGEDAAAAAALEECCLQVEQLAARLPRGSTGFAVGHVCMRLELMAAGAWPGRAPASPDLGRISDLMLTACKLSAEEVLRVYDGLLRLPGGEGEGERLHLPLVRLRLLESLLRVLRALAQRASWDRPASGFGRLQGPLGREVGRLIEACARYKAEAGRLEPGVASDGLVRDFGDLEAGLKASLEGR